MLKATVAVVAAAIPAFGAGMWTESTLAEYQRTETRVVTTTSTISPSEMHGKVKPDDLPVQYMQGDFN
jgi:hypothetical protein